MIVHVCVYRTDCSPQLSRVLKDVLIADPGVLWLNFKK